MSDKIMMGDRTDFSPKHVGPNILPSFPLFTQLLTTAHRKPTSIAIRDVNLNTESTYVQLLTDVLSLRRSIENVLSPETLRQIKNGEEVFIVVVAPGGYEFTVAILAVLALGAAGVPITPSQPVKEALYYAQKSRAIAVVTSSSALTLGKELEKAAQEAGQRLPCVLARDSMFNTPLAPSEILLSSDRYLDSNGASLVIFTSGTTGPPKGVVQRRVLVDDGSSWCAQQMELDSSDVLLHLLPVHHATGIEVSFFPFLFTGACIEFRSGSFDAEWTWDRWAKGDITFFSGVPTIYTRMMRYYQQNLSKRPAGEVARYVAGARRFKGAICGTSALPHSISDFWTELFGKKIVQRYGSTESCVVFNMPIGAASATVPDGSVGKVSWGVDVKLSEGDEGEILIKSPLLFAKYLHDPKATADALDEEGYFKSGDIARKEGEYFWIMGRASVDILKSGGYKISALDIEREILALPYISEVMVVGVPDDEFGQRVAAVVSLQTDNLDVEWSRSHGSPSFVLTLDALRRDLSSRLAGYKRPTLLRVITHEFPRTPSGKVVKKLLGPQYFPQNYETLSEVQSWKAPSSSSRARL